MTCEELYKQLKDDLGPRYTLQQQLAVEKVYEECKKTEQQGVHAASKDEAYYEFIEALEELARLRDSPLRPRPPRCGPYTQALRAEMFSDRRKAMLISRRMSEALREAKLTVGDDKTYVCLICVVDKPTYASEALDIDPMEVRQPGGNPVNYIYEPAIMESVLEKVESDKIDYGGPS